MFFTLRNVDPQRKLCQQLSLDVLERVVPLSTIRQALHETGASTPRQRKLNLETILLLVIAMNLYAQESLGAVLQRITHGLRLVWPEPEPGLPRESALVYRRYQLGARPLAALFRHVCRPIATQDTPGAFLFGLRLMALDGQTLDVADTQQNVAYFGKMAGGRGPSAFAKVRAVYLCELGTHAIVDAGFWPCAVSESVGANRLLRSAGQGMLVQFDRGLWAYERVKAVRGRGAHVLCRLPANIHPVVERPLKDGSSLVWIAPAQARLHTGTSTGKDQVRLLVRLIEYTISDPQVPGYGQRYRLITTLLEPELYPARELAVAYHERWEIEIALDEMETHQHLADGPLRSKKPLGVLQELYGLLIAHFAVRFLMHEAALAAGVDPDRLSFVRALRLVGEAVRDFALAAPPVFPRLYGRLLQEIACPVLPPRRARSNPRVVKRKMSNFDLKRPEHYHLPKLKHPFHEVIVLI
jgi:hypothetical protein